MKRTGEHLSILDKQNFLFNQIEITFLGITLSKNGLYPDDSIIQTLSEIKYAQNDVKLRNVFECLKNFKQEWCYISSN